MKIKVGDYTMQSDRYSMWVMKNKVVAAGKNKGEKYETRVAGYASTLPLLRRQFVENCYKDSDAETLKGLLKELEQCFEDMVMLDETAVKKDFRIMRRLAKEKGIK